MKLFLIVIMLLVCSCASVRKNNTTSTRDQVHIDTSSHEHQYNRETVTEEKGSVPVTTSSDSVQTSGTMSAEDTTEYRQDAETDGISLSTTIKPKVKDGRITGYQVNSRAVVKPRTVNIPVDRKTTTKETGSYKQQTGITDTKKETVVVSTKETSSLSPWVKIAVIAAGILFLCLLIFRLWE